MASGKLLEACWLGAGGEPKGCLPEAKSWGAGGGRGEGRESMNRNSLDSLWTLASAYLPFKSVQN